VLLLALETATGGAGLAVARGERVLAELDLAPERPVSEQILPALDTLLGLAGVSLPQIEAFAISIGPGSFTGLRVGLATLKGLAFGVDAPVAAVPTLAALAAGAAPAPGPVAALLDARRGEVYAAVFPEAGALEPTLLPEGVYEARALTEKLPAGCMVVGEGALLHREALTAPGGAPRLALADRRHAFARAADVARLGARLLSAGQIARAEDVVPRYLRRAEAEARRTGERLEEATHQGRPPRAGPL
jgi:tRNA threonylcarbamoyladenosine biosynthesis protein TsaB